MGQNKLDAKDLKCPMPIIKISKAFKELEQGQTLEIEANDPVFEADLRAWCRRTGNELVEIEDSKSYVRAVVKKAS